MDHGLCETFRSTQVQYFFFREANEMPTGHVPIQHTAASLQLSRFNGLTHISHALLKKTSV